MQAQPVGLAGVQDDGGVTGDPKLRLRQVADRLGRVVRAVRRHETAQGVIARSDPVHLVVRTRVVAVLARVGVEADEVQGGGGHRGLAVPVDDLDPERDRLGLDVERDRHGDVHTTARGQDPAGDATVLAVLQAGGGVDPQRHLSGGARGDCHLALVRLDDTRGDIAAVVAVHTADLQVQGDGAVAGVGERHLHGGAVRGVLRPVVAAGLDGGCGDHLLVHRTEHVEDPAAGLVGATDLAAGAGGGDKGRLDLLRGPVRVCLAGDGRGARDMRRGHRGTGLVRYA